MCCIKVLWNGGSRVTTALQGDGTHCLEVSCNGGCSRCDWGYTLTFGFWAYALIMRCSAKGKQPNKQRCCCHLGLYLICFDSFGFVFDLFSFVRSFFRSIDSSSSLRYIPSNSTSFVVIEVILTTVYLLYTSLIGSTVRLPHDFIFYHMLMVLPVEVVTDMFINKTTPTATLREQSFRCDLRWILYCALTV